VERCALELHVDGAWTERAALPCPSGPTRLLIAGDVGLPTETLRLTLLGAQSWCGEHGCDLGLLPGDILYDDGVRAAQHWSAIWGGGFRRLGFPFLAALGNHEYRHEENPHLKREVLYATDGKDGFVLPSSSYAARLQDPAGKTLLAIAAVDTDSVANPGDGMPGLGDAALETACGTGAPVVWLGHHPLSSQGLHHLHEAQVESSLRATLAKAIDGGCSVAFAAAGHDHDLQAYGPGCQEPGAPAVVVGGPSGRGFRGRGSTHLTPCPGDGDAVTRYFGGPSLAGGFAWVAVAASGEVEVRLVEASKDGVRVLSTDRWSVGGD